MQRDALIMGAVLRAAAVYKGPVYACKNEIQKEMCAKYNLSFQEGLYVDIDYSPEGALVAVAKSKMATPEIIYNRILASAQKDKRDHNEGGVLKIGFSGRPFSVCLHSDMPTALQNRRRHARLWTRRTRRCVSNNHCRARARVARLLTSLKTC